MEPPGHPGLFDTSIYFQAYNIPLWLLCVETNWVDIFVICLSLLAKVVKLYSEVKTQFHQIQYRMYAAGDQVKSFNPNLEENEKAELKKIETLWAKNKIGN